MTKEEWYAQLFERLGNSKFRSSFHLKQKELSQVQQDYLVDVIMTWIEKEMKQHVEN